MANFGGIIAGALGGGAGAAQNLAAGYIEDERRLTLQQQLSKMEEERQTRIAEATETRRRAGRQADTEQDISNAPRVAASAAATKRTVGAAENEVAGARTGIVGRAEAAVGREANAASATPEQLRATRAQAQAKAVFSPNAYAEADLARMKSEDLRAHRALVDEYGQVEADTSLTDAQRQNKLAGIQKRIELNAAKAGVKPANETDQVETTTKRIDEQGNEITEKSVSKRKAPPGGGPAPKPKAAPPVGTVSVDAQGRQRRFSGGDVADEKNWPLADRSATGKVQ